MPLKSFLGGQMKREIALLSIVFILVASQNISTSVYAKENEKSKPEKTEKVVQQQKVERTKETEKVEIKRTELATPSASPKNTASPSASQNPTVKRDKNGAQFELDQVTGLVTVTTPSGNTHTLKLPTKAVANMFRNQLISNPPASDSATQATTDQDTVVTKEVTETKFLMGAIPVKVKMNLKINTVTGETIVEPKSFLARLFSFLFAN